MYGLRGMFGVSSLFFLLALGALFFLQIDGFADDPGLGWHLATGKWIFANSALPNADPFLYSQAGKTWLPEQWFADLLLYLTYQLSGWTGLYLAGGALFFLSYSVLLYPALLRFGGSALASCLATLLAFKMAQVHFVLRPLIFNFPFFALVLALCWLSPTRLKFWHLAFGIFVVFALWANIHPSFVLGLALLGIKIVALLVESILGHTSTRTNLILFSGLLLFAISGSLLTPFGLDLYPHILWHSQSELVSKVFVEWRPTDLGRFEGELLLLASLIVLLGALFSRPLNVFLYFSCLLFIPWSFLSVRILPFAGMVALPLLVVGFESLGKLILALTKSRYRLIFRACTSIYDREQNAAFAPKLSLLALLVIIICAAIFKIIPGQNFWGPSFNKYPYTALEFLANQQPKRDVRGAGGKSIKILNDMDWGGFITWYNSEKLSSGSVKLLPYIDDRAALLGDAFLRGYLVSLRPEGDWRNYINSTGADYLLLKAEDPLVREITTKKAFPVTYTDELVRIFTLNAEREKK